MKKYYLLIALAAAALGFASCSSEDVVGVESQDETTTVGAIEFRSTSHGATRTNYEGANAAGLLGSNFVVYGIKGSSSTAPVFSNYQVNYTASTANTTETNSSNWEYVNGTWKYLAATTSGNKTISECCDAGSGKVQSIKYWDYSANQYDFAAYSFGKAATGSCPTGTVIAKPSAVDGAWFTLSGTAAQLKNAYISDLVTVYDNNGDNSAKNVNGNAYGSKVSLQFRSLAAKARIGIYETVPGYSIKDVYFYSEEKTANDGKDITNTTGTLYAVGGTLPTSGSYAVSYPTVGATNFDKADYNDAHVTFTAATGETQATTATFGAFVAADGTNNYNKTFKSANGQETTGSYLSTSAAAPTYAGVYTNAEDGVSAANAYYTTVLPNEAGTVLKLKVNYTLVSTDGSGEEIYVKGAEAVVPQAYTKWQSNYAYTYLFKISDNTNGYSDPTDTSHAGLYPITFDAVVTEDVEGNQETITTVATPSITTYQLGQIVNEYNAGDIYVSVMNGSTPVTLTDANACVYELTEATGVTATEALFQDQLNGTKSNTGLTIASVPTVSFETSVPAVDGNTLSVSAAKFTAEASKVYAFVYTVSSTEHYVKIIRVQ